MKRRVDSKQMEGWVDKLQSNMTTFLENENADAVVTPQQKLNFIRQQYVLLDTTVKVLNGKAHFVGCVHPAN